jgi:acyl carrier protein
MTILPLRQICFMSGAIIWGFRMSGRGLTPERLQKRLSRIFCEVFPELTPEAAPGATMESVAGWDSIATLTLFMACEEDFGIKIGYDRIAETRSFEELAGLVAGLTG